MTSPEYSVGRSCAAVLACLVLCACSTEGDDGGATTTARATNSASPNKSDLAMGAPTAVGSEVEHRLTWVEPVQADWRPAGLPPEHCSPARVIDATRALAVCRETARDSLKDYGLRLYVIRIPSGDPISVSRGFLDAFAVDLRWAYSTVQRDDIIIGAEESAETPVGVVFFRFRGGALQELGSLSAVAVDSTGEPAPILSVADVVENDDSLSLLLRGPAAVSLEDGTFESVSADETCWRIASPSSLRGRPSGSRTCTVK